MFVNYKIVFLASFLSQISVVVAYLMLNFVILLYIKKNIVNDQKID